MRRHLSAVVALAALITALGGAPASAATHTFWVDDDGAAGPIGCGGSATAATTIGGALATAAATPGHADTILVCPGRYREVVNITDPALDGVTIRAVKRFKAVVSPRATHSGRIIQVAAADVTIQWLKVVAPTTGACNQTFSAVSVVADGARIVANRVIASPKGDTYYGPCPMDVGIRVQGSSGAEVLHNVVRDFKTAGILVLGADARVVNNSVQFWHDSASACAGRLACRTATVRPAAWEEAGIIADTSGGVIALNAVTSAPGGYDPALPLSYDITIESSDGVTVRQNYLVGGRSGINMFNTDGALVKGNVIVGGTPAQPGSAARRHATTTAEPALLVLAGIGLGDGTASTLRGNHVLSFPAGIVMRGGAIANLVTGNDATGNGWDCEDDNVSTAGDPVVANTWIDNLGNLDLPDGLCTDGPVQTNPGSPT